MIYSSTGEKQHRLCRYPPCTKCSKSPRPILLYTGRFSLVVCIDHKFDLSSIQLLDPVRSRIIWDIHTLPSLAHIENDTAEVKSCYCYYRLCPSKFASLSPATPMGAGCGDMG